MFYFSNIEILHKEMKRINEYRITYSFSYNQKYFSCIILFDIIPYRLYMNALGKENLSFEFEINELYHCSSYIEHYHDLINFLNIKYDPNNKFSPNTLLKVLNNKTPTNYNNKKPRYNDVLKMVKKHRKIDEQNKIYFCGWRKNPINCNVTKENLEKTTSAFGYKFYRICLKYNISSCWTSDLNEEKLIEINKLLNVT